MTKGDIMFKELGYSTGDLIDCVFIDKDDEQSYIIIEYSGNVRFVNQLGTNCKIEHKYSFEEIEAIYQTIQEIKAGR